MKKDYENIALLKLKNTFEEKYNNCNLSDKPDIKCSGGKLLVEVTTAFNQGYHKLISKLTQPITHEQLKIKELKGLKYHKFCTINKLKILFDNKEQAFNKLLENIDPVVIDNGKIKKLSNFSKLDQYEENKPVYNYASYQKKFKFICNADKNKYYNPIDTFSYWGNQLDEIKEAIRKKNELARNYLSTNLNCEELNLIILTNDVDDDQIDKIIKYINKHKEFMYTYVYIFDVENDKLITIDVKDSKKV